MKIIKEYRKSVKYRCRKCKNVTTSKKGSPCAVSGVCGTCFENQR